MSANPETSAVAGCTHEPATRSPTSGPRAVDVRRAAAAVDGRATIASEKLFAGEKEVLIAHGGAVYRLRQTALGKLILTK